MDGAGIRSFVDSHLRHWQGARALYREGVGVSLVQLDDVITTSEQGLSTVCFRVPVPGLRDRRASWTIFLSWQASSFRVDTWVNGYVPMTIWFEQSLIDATLKLVSRLHAVEDGADHSQRAWHFARKFARLSAERQRPLD
jgi:hypothetical protein